MRRRALGRTGITTGELGLGTWGLSGDAYGPVAEGEATRTIARALELGVELFDTSDAYGKGAMERALGKLLPKASGLVVTKLGTDRDATPPRKRFDLSYLREAFEKSQERLARDAIDVVLLHNPTKEAIDKGEALEFLRELKKRGLVRAYGVSVGDVETARASIKMGAEVLELAYNAFFAKDLHDLSDDIASTETAVLARSVLAHGLLAGHWSASREFYAGDHRARRWEPHELAHRVAQLDTLRPLVSGQVLSLRAAALRFVLSNDLVSAVVLGPRSVTQLEQLVREAGEGPPYLKDTQLAELAARLKSAGIVV